MILEMSQIAKVFLYYVLFECFVISTSIKVTTILLYSSLDTFLCSAPLNQHPGDSPEAMGSSPRIFEIFVNDKIGNKLNNLKAFFDITSFTCLVTMILKIQLIIIYKLILLILKGR